MFKVRCNVLTAPSTLTDRFIEPSPVERTQIAPFAGDFPNTNPRVLKHRASRVEEWIDQQSHDDKPEGILREAGVSHHRAVNSLPSLQPSLAEQSDYIFVDEVSTSHHASSIVSQI